jgi:hypothetical protein
MIRGIDYVTIEVFGLNQSGEASLEECQGLLDVNPMFKEFRAEALNHRRGTGYVDVALYPKDGDKRKFIEDIKKYGL